MIGSGRPDICRKIFSFDKMHFPKIVNCIKGGQKSAANGSQSRRFKSSACSSSRRPTKESTHSLRQRSAAASLKIDESDIERSSPSPLPITVRELQAVFRKFDANGDGKISWSELGMLMTSLGCPASDEELRLMVSVADSDGDGFIDFSEFAVLNTFAVDDPCGLQDMKSAFGIFDFDGNGLISPDELLRVFESLGERCSLEDCRNMIARVDSNGDGFVSFDEFLRMMNASASGSASGSVSST